MADSEKAAAETAELPIELITLPGPWEVTIEAREADMVGPDSEYYNPSVIVSPELWPFGMHRSTATIYFEQVAPEKAPLPQIAEQTTVVDPCLSWPLN